MSRVNYAVEKAFRIYKENSDSEFIDFLFGSAAPGGDTGEQDDAPIGSMYFRQNGGSSTIYQKIANAGATSDWQENGASAVSIGTFRPEKIRAVTNDTVTAGAARDLGASPFADDEGTQLAAGDFAVGEFIIADADGTPVLLEVTNVSAPNVTFSTPGSAPALAESDSFVTANYLPDSPADQEGQALVQYNGSVMAKIGDVDWNFANGIGIAAGYTPASGDISASDTVQSAIEKLDGNNDDQDSVLGTSQGDTDLGTFTGTTISDSNSVKGALQELETAYEETDQNVDDLITLSGVAENSTDLGTFPGDLIPDASTVKDALSTLEDAAEGFPEVETGVSSPTVLDELLVDDFRSCAWLVTAFDEANPADIKSAIIHGANDGTSGADAANVDDNVAALLIKGSFNTGISVGLNGSGASQTMQLLVDSSEPGVTYTAVRLGAAPSGY